MSRWGHCAAAFITHPRKTTEVVVFGGKSSDDYLASTTILQFGKLLSIATLYPR